MLSLLLIYCLCTVYIFLPFCIYQISGDPDLAKDALVQVTSRIRANLFDREGAVSAMVPVLPYLPMSADGSDGLKYDSRDSRRHGRGPYSSGYGDASDLPSVDGYGSYGGSQVVINVFPSCKS